jgi:hypothetical protein
VKSQIAVRTRLIFICVLWSIMMVAQRSPAPIVEEEKPTPAPETSSSTKSRSRRAESSGSTKSETRAREPSKLRGFAGTWSGKINQAFLGDILFTFTFTPGSSQVTEHTAFGTYSHPFTVNGQTASWQSGLVNDTSWTFTPNGDGSTAHVIAKSPLGTSGDTTFRRGGPPAVVRPASEYPIARPVPEKPGFVYNPFDPTSRIFIDVRGKPSGTKLTDPKSGKVFIVP